jgi:hypothetical protein
MAYFETLDNDQPTYKPPPLPTVGGAPSGVGGYNAPPLRPPTPGTFNGFAPGEVVRNTPPTTPNTPPNTSQQPFPQQPNGGGVFNPSAIQQHLFSQPVSIQSLQQSFPYFMQQGWLPQGSYLENSQTPDEIFVPGMGWIDTLVGADSGNPTSWSWQTGGGGMGNYFSDPVLQQFLNMGEGAISQLLQPQAINPTLQAAIDSLMRSISADAGFGEFAAIARPRLEQLQNPAYTDRERDIIRTNFSDPLERQRTARMQQETLRMAGRGITPESGIFTEAMLGLNRDFDIARTIGDRELAVREIGLEDERGREAISIGQIMASLLGQDRAGDISAAGSLAGIGGSLQDAPIRNLLSAVGISQNMAQMPFQSMSAAQGALNSMNPTMPQSDMGGIISLLMTLAGQGENANAVANGQNAQTWASVMELLDSLWNGNNDSGDG